MAFTHLHVKSHYSLLGALPKIPELIARAKQEGMEALALTDNGNLYGAMEFYKACKEAGIKPILGVEFYEALRGRTDKHAGIDNKRSRLILLAKNEIGYKNLLKLVTRSHLEGFYYKPRIDKALLQEHHEGLLAIAPVHNGEISRALKGNDTGRARELASFYASLFKNDFFLEVTAHAEIAGHSELLQRVVTLAKETGTPLVAAHDIMYLSPDDKKAWQTLMLVNSHTDQTETLKEEEGDFSFQGTLAMEEKFKNLPEALANVREVASRCNLELKLGSWVFPDYKTRGGVSHDEELQRLSMEGLSMRNMQETPEIAQRIAYELGIIAKKGFAPYFLVVADLLRFAHENGILTTTRGSAAGSLISYLTGITNVNPLEYNLPFERFLNPERPSAPDVDMDFADNRRDEVIEYAKQKYGRDHVAQIGTFGTMMARGSVRDVSRAMGFEYSLGDRIAKLIPFGAQGFPMSIDRAIEMVPELKKMYTDEKDAATIIDMSKKIEGCARHISVHAAGVLIAPAPLTEFVPLQFDPKGENKIITQYDMHATEDAGLLKLDFLGIKNLSILADAVTHVAELEQKRIDIENIPLDDKKTFEMLARGETGGIFQLNGGGMTRYLKELRPTSIHDINAMVALYRPGPMESIPQYIERKREPLLVSYLDPRLENILKRSYGVVTYQDDVLEIAIRLAGFSWLEADKLRKAMGKKIPEEMAAHKEKLIAGFIKNGMDRNTAEKMWLLIEPFAAYGFNRAHAVCYGKVAYQTAYMKANFPAIYMASVLTADSGDVEKIAESVVECKRMNIPVLPPSINESFEGFTVVKSPLEKGALPSSAGGLLQPPKAAPFAKGDKIRFGLTTIKNFGEGIAKAIIDERKQNGYFKSLADFLERIKDRNLNKKSLEALIKSGALDELGERGTMLANVETLLEYSKEQNKQATNQDSLFGLMADSSSVPALKLKEAAPLSMEEKLAWEKELLGLYVSGHPLDKFREVLEKREYSIAKIKEEFRDGMTVVIGGIVEEAKPIITK
ncbi:MAG: DNA polymerase III subunit alpha, partial [bacterium]|nr:DNA polymerase III subunit alpha [bacterium]